jgi:hypothetical protein
MLNILNLKSLKLILLRADGPDNRNNVQWTIGFREKTRFNWHGKIWLTEAIIKHQSQETLRIFLSILLLINGNKVMTNLLISHVGPISVDVHLLAFIIIIH